MLVFTLFQTEVKLIGCLVGWVGFMAYQPLYIIWLLQIVILRFSLYNFVC